MKARARSGRGSRAHARGIVSLEFVLMLPFLLMLLFGIVDVSMVLCDKAVITNAAGEAARQGVVLRASPYTQSQIRTVALAYTNNGLVTSGTNTPPTVTVSPTGGCAAAGSSNPLQVSISYTYNGVVLGSAFSALSGPVTVKAVAVKNCE